jgi:Domain of unknown function (DUF3516)
VLRYVADAYRTLRQTVPEAAHTEELDDIIEWLGELVRQVDSSLLDEWEQLRAGTDDSGAGPAPVPTGPPRVTANTRAFRVLVRNALFRRVELAARRDWAALGELDASDGWGAAEWREALEPYFIVEELPGRWRVRQILDDPAGDHDWGFAVEVDLAASDELGEAAVTLVEVGRL